MSKRPAQQAPVAPPPRNPRPRNRLSLFVCLLALLPPSSAAIAQQTSSVLLPDAPGFGATPDPAQTTSPNPSQSSAAITGAITDPNGALVTGASVVLTIGGDRKAQISDASGHFTFSNLPPAPFQLTVIAPDLAPFTTSATLYPGQTLDLTPIPLHLASAIVDMEVNAGRSEIAAAQVSLEEKQRVFGIFPNFYAVYIWNAAPLTPRQKFALAWRSSIDPVTFGVTGVIAGIEQSTNAFSGYGQGAQGFGKRYGAVYADGFISSMIGGALLPSVLHQDPRYYVMGTGSGRKRALYAVSTVVICKGDNGRWQPNYSNIFGNLASAGISNLYYPASNRNGAGLTVSNALIGTASGAISSLLQEFVLRRITPDIPDYNTHTDASPATPSIPAPLK